MSSVSDALECPRRSLTTFRSTPFLSNWDAWACLKSWNRIGMPWRDLNDHQAEEREPGLQTRPSGADATRSLSCQADPKESRCSDCFVLCSRRNSTARVGSTIVQWLLSAFRSLVRTPVFVCSVTWVTTRVSASRSTSCHRSPTIPPQTHALGDGENHGREKPRIRVSRWLQTSGSSCQSRMILRSGRGH